MSTNEERPDYKSWPDPPNLLDHPGVIGRMSKRDTLMYTMGVVDAGSAIAVDVLRADLGPRGDTMAGQILAENLKTVTGVKEEIIMMLHEHELTNGADE